MRKKDLRLNALGGIAEGRKIRDRITALMTREGLNPGDAVVLCVFAEPELSLQVKLPLPVELSVDGAGDLAQIVANEGKLPIGYLVFVVDRQDPQRPIFGHARPLIVSPPGIELNDRALRAYTHILRDNLMQSGEIPDTRS
jgi:hypothetical protein